MRALAVAKASAIQQKRKGKVKQKAKKSTQDKHR
jgi:hypothetical protein